MYKILVVILVAILLFLIAYNQKRMPLDSQKEENKQPTVFKQPYSVPQSFTANSAKSGDSLMLWLYALY